eukprot:3154848-Pleurochrysis_carterae.AAC.1
MGGDRLGRSRCPSWCKSRASERWRAALWSEVERRSRFEAALAHALPTAVSACACLKRCEGVCAGVLRVAWGERAARLRTSARGELQLCEGRGAEYRSKRRRALRRQAYPAPLPTWMCTHRRLCTCA